MRISLLIYALGLPWKLVAFSPSYRFASRGGVSSEPTISSSVHRQASKATNDQAETETTTTSSRHQQKEGAITETAGGAIVKKKKNEGNELLEALVDATIEGSKDLFVFLRWTAANALTASLPDDERKELLSRMAIDTEKPDVKKLKKSEKDDYGVEGDEELSSVSVNEKIAAAVAAESQRDKKKWEREKEKILKQAEEAANERVKTDLAIQKQRMELERTRMREEIEAAKWQLEEEKKVLKEQQEQRDQEAPGVEKEVAEMLTSEGKEDLNAMDIKLQKRAQQKEKLALVEQDLRKQAQQIVKDKKEVDKLLQELQAARDRVEKEKNPNKSKIESRYYTPKEYRSLASEEKARLNALREAEASASEEDPGVTKTVTSNTVKLAQKEAELAAPRDSVHPVLGPVVLDLGYKRIHLMSAGKLATIPIWKKQRTFRINRAKAMAADKVNSLHLGFPGVICLHEEENGKLTIIDGQHRVGMMSLLKELQNKEEQDVSSNSTLSNNKHLIDLDRILVEVYSQQQNVSKSDHAEEIFLEINKAEPIKLVDMPGVAKAKDRKVITGAVNLLQDQYPEMFSASQRCRVPNVNIDNMRNNLFGANVMKRHSLTTSKKLFDWMLEQNAALGEKYENDQVAQGWINARAWKKASRNGFYLGLESSWLYS